MFIFRPVSRSAAYTFANNVYVFGSNAQSTNIHRYNGTTVTQDTAVMPDVLSAHSAAALTASDIYLFGGLLGGSTPSTNATASIHKFTGLGCIVSNSLASATHYTSTTVVSGTAFIFGGISSGNATQTSIQRFNGTSVSTDGATLDSPSGGITGKYACAAPIFTESFIFGGVNTAVPTIFNNIQRYNGSSRTIDGATLGTAVYASSAVPFNSIIYIFGGGVNWSTPSYTVNIQEYDGNTTATNSATLSVGIGYHPCSVLGSNVFIFGGSTASNWSNIIQRFNTVAVTTDSATLFKPQNSSAASVTQVNVYMI